VITIAEVVIRAHVAVVARAVMPVVQADAGHAGIDGAFNTVRTVHRSALADAVFIAHIIQGAPVEVVASLRNGLVLTTVERIAIVTGAFVTIVAVDRETLADAGLDIALILVRARIVVVARGSPRGVRASEIGVATVDGALVVVIASETGARLANAVRIAGVAGSARIRVVARHPFRGGILGTADGRPASQAHVIGGRLVLEKAFAANHAEFGLHANLAFAQRIAILLGAEQAVVRARLARLAGAPVRFRGIAPGLVTAVDVVDIAVYVGIIHEAVIHGIARLAFVPSDVPAFVRLTFVMRDVQLDNPILVRNIPDHVANLIAATAAGKSRHRKGQTDDILKTLHL